MIRDYRPGRPEDEEQILDFANMVFSMDEEPHDFAALLPKVYSRPGFARKHVLCVDEQQRILAMVGLHVVTLRVGEWTLQCGLVGTVSTHPRHRGQGHMKRLMKLAEDMAREQGCDMLLLGGQRQRYGYFGFEQGALRIRMEVEADNLRHAGAKARDEVRFLPLEQVPDEMLNDVFSLYQVQHMVAERTKEDFSAVLRTWLGRGYAVLHGIKLLGYVYVVRGDWREFAFFDPSVIPGVLAAWQRFERTGLTRLTLGLHQRDLLCQLGQIAENTVMEDAMMVKVLRWQPVLKRLLAFRNTVMPLEEGNLIVEIEGERLRIQASSHGVMVHTVQDKPMVILSHRQAVTTLLSMQGMWHQEARAFHNWLPLWLALPSADMF